jgi:hypothetical protein
VLGPACAAVPRSHGGDCALRWTRPLRLAPCRFVCCVSQKSRQSPRTSPECCRAARSAACAPVAGALICAPCHSARALAALCAAHVPARLISLPMRSLWQAQGQQTGARYISKFEFPYTFRGQQCQFVMTAVLGHLQNLEFGERYPLFLPPRCHHAILSLLQLAVYFAPVQS